MAKSFFLLGIFITLFTKSLYAIDPTKIMILAPEDFDNKHIILKFSHKVANGPCDAYCVIAQEDLPILKKDSDGNFLKFITTKGHHCSLDDSLNRIERFPLQLGIFHTFGLASYLLQLNKQDSELIEAIAPHAKQIWNTFSPFFIDPYAEIDDLYHIDQTKGIYFGKIEKDSSSQPIQWIAQSFEAVAFVTGQAILMRHCPHLTVSTPIAEAIRISYGDLTSILGLFSLKPLRDQYLEKTHGDLHDTALLPIASEKFSFSNDGFSLKKRYDAILLSENLENDPLNFSKVFTAAVYDALIESFQISAIGTPRESKSDLLKMISIQLRQLLFAALLKTPALNLSLKNVAETMISIARNNTQYEDFSPFLDLGFKQRGILIETPRENLSSDTSLYAPFIATHPISLIASGGE